jgi:hypothetical protein
MALTRCVGDGSLSTASKWESIVSVLPGRRVGPHLVRSPSGTHLGKEATLVHQPPASGEDADPREQRALLVDVGRVRACALEYARLRGAPWGVRQRGTPCAVG